MYRPMTIANPLYQRQSSWVGHRALSPDNEKFPDLNSMENQLNVKPEISSSAENAVRLVKECFTITKVSNRGNKKL